MGNVNKNPGTVADLHKECKDLMPNSFEGFILMVSNGLSNHFQLLHTVSLWSPNPIGYRFGAVYVGTKQFPPNSPFPVMSGDIDIWGNLNATIIHQFTEKFRFKFASQIQEREMVAAHLMTDYRGDNFTASVTIGNPNIINNSGVVVSQYLQSVTDQLSLGGEFLCQYGPNLPGGRSTVVSAVARYVHKTSAWSGALGLGGLHLCYSQKIIEHLHVGFEIETSFRMLQTVASIRGKLDLPEADLVLRGMVDSQLNVSGVLEKRLKPISCSLALSGRFDHNKNQFRFGSGLIIG